MITKNKKTTITLDLSDLTDDAFELYYDAADMMTIALSDLFVALLQDEYARRSVVNEEGYPWPEPKSRPVEDRFSLQLQNVEEELEKQGISVDGYHDLMDDMGVGHAVKSFFSETDKQGVELDHWDWNRFQAIHDEVVEG